MHDDKIGKEAKAISHSMFTSRDRSSDLKCPIVPNVVEKCNICQQLNATCAKAADHLLHVKN